MNIKWFSIVTIGMTIGICLASTPPSALNSGPIASDQQNEAKDLAGKRGQQQVDLFTGSFDYSIPIACAPARNGSEPNLALAYSSGGENGWCGMGWKLDIGHIERNTKDGFPIKFSNATIPAPLTQYNDTNGFILNLFGNEIKLLPTATANEYRAEVDTDFLRCILDTSNNKWTVYDKSGNVYRFGQSSSSRVANTKSGWSGYSATFDWALDEIDTATGDQTTVAYTNYNDPNNSSIPEKIIYPTQITYNSHTNFNGYTATFTGEHKILFGLESNPRPDRRFSYRWGFRTEQNRRLSTITCQVGSQNVWRYNLNYGISPATERSLLTNVVIYGFDAGNNATALLTNTFAYQYNPKAVSFGPTIQWGNLNLADPDGSGSLPYVAQVNGDSSTIADLIDIDGDGLPDRVVWDDTGSYPFRYQVQKNLGMQSNGNGLFSNRYAFGPTATGNTTGSLSNPIPSNDAWSAMNAPHLRIRDINGDGLPDRLADCWQHFFSYTQTSFTNFEVMLNNGDGFGTAAPWQVSEGPLAGDNLNLFDGIEAGTTVQSSGTYVGFFDINGDGLPDRVMALYASLQGAMTNFEVQFNTGTNFTPVKLFGPYHSQNYNSPSQSQPQSWAGIETLNGIMLDINGDGLPDRVMLPMNPSTPGIRLSAAATIYFAVEYDDGYGFDATNTSKSVPGASDIWPGVNSQTNAHYDFSEIQNLPYVGMFDLNGDGLPDRVMLDPTAVGTSSSRWLVYLNNGRGFDSTPITVTNIESQGQWSAAYEPDWWSMQGSYYGSTIVTLMDINGDGLLDRVMATYNGTSNYFLVQLNQGPFPDLLTNINNGIGGNITVTYKSSTAWDNRTDPTDSNSGSRMPFPMQTVATVIESDGINSPCTNSYSYAGGFYDGVRREFAGFAVVTNIDASLRKTITYFHTGGGRNYSALGEFQDTNSATGAGNFAKRGMAYRIESYGTDSLLYKMIINQVDQTNIGYSTFARYFPFVSQTFEYDYPGGGTPRITGSKFVYSPTATDAKIFNLTQKALWGEVTNVNLTAIASPTDVVPADTKYINTSYATLSDNSYILDHPATDDLLDSGNNVIQETKYTYDSYSGVIATKLTQISAGYYATNSHGSYTTFGLVGLTTDPVGVQTEITYDSTYNIYPATTTIGGNFTTTTAYDPRSGALAVSTDPAGLTVSNSFDIFLRPIEVDKIPIGGGSAVWVKKISYPAVLKPIVSGIATNYIDVIANDGVGGVESRTYVDGFDRPIQTRTQGENGNFRMVATGYDSRGNAFFTTWPIFTNSINFSKPASGLTASWIGYDAAGRAATNRPVNVTFNSNGAFSSKSDLTGDSGSPLAAKTWSYVNDTDPWWIICTDEDGQIRRYGLDAFGLTNQIQEADGSSTYTTTLKYDLADNLTNIVNANGENIYWAFDDAGNVVAMADPYLGQWTYQRDYAGRVRVQTDGRGDVIKLYYINPTTGYQDPLGRVQWKEIYSLNYTNQTLALVSTVTNLFDSSDDGNYTVYPGLLYEVIDSQGWEKNGYDPLTRTIKTTRHLNINNQSYTNSYTFDDGDNVTSTAYPNSGPTITNTYWHGGSIHQVSLFGSGYNYYTANAAAFDEFEHVTSCMYGNGLTTAHSYYSVSKRLQSISSGSVFSRNYQYTAGDDVTSISGTGITNTESITYYNLHRIKSYSGLSGNYSYDPVGTILNNTESGGSSYYLGNARKQAVKTAFDMTNLYDLCGNMIVRHGSATNSQSLEYDPENQLILLSQAGVVVDEFGYAWDGGRLWKRIDQSATNTQVWIGNIYEEKGGKTLFHVFAGNEQVCTFEADSPLAGGSDTNKVGYYYHQDNLNTSSALSDSSGSQTEVNVYYPFGRMQTATPQASFQVSRRFTGQVFDAESGLYYYNARYYDPELGRFIQPDTIIPDLSNPQSYNRYSYVLNDPLKYTDPTGHYGVSDWWRDTQEGSSIISGWFSSTVQSAGQGIGHFFMGDTSVHWDPNSYNALSGGTLGQQIPSVGNPATAVAGAVLQAGMMMGPAGDVKLAEEGEKAITVLGHYADDYIGMAEGLKAKGLKANYFKIPSEVWNKMSLAEQWAANKTFLDKAIARGDDIVLATPANKARKGSFFARELRYLEKKGYKPSADGKKMIRPHRKKK